MDACRPILPYKRCKWLRVCWWNLTQAFSVTWSNINLSVCSHTLLSNFTSKIQTALYNTLGLQHLIVSTILWQPQNAQLFQSTALIVNRLIVCWCILDYQPLVTVRSLLPGHERGIADRLTFEHLQHPSTRLRNIWNLTSLICLSLASRRGTLTMLGALDVVRTAYCAL